MPVNIITTAIVNTTAIVGACTQIYSLSVKLTNILVMTSTKALSRQNLHCLQQSEESDTHFSQHCGYKFIRYALYHFSEHINQIGLCGNREIFCSKTKTK